MKVKLLAYTPDPEKVVAAAAKLCYSKADIDTIMDGLTDEKITKFLSALVERGHMSPFEHASFTFGIEDVSRACYDSQTEILTKRGWKFLKDLPEDVEVATLNDSTKQVEFQRITEKISYRYTGLMHHIHTQGVDLVVTDNHSLYFKKQDAVNKYNNHKTYLTPINQIGCSKLIFSKDFNYDNTTEDVVTIYGHEYDRKDNQGRTITRRTPDLTFDKGLFLRFLAWYLSDGSTYYDAKEQKYIISISQKNTQINQERGTIQRIVNIVKELGFNPYIDRNANSIKFNSLTLGYFLKSLGTAYHKKIPYEIYSFFNKKYALTFLQEYLLGDGSTDKNGCSKLYTSSPILADQLYQLVFLAGWTCLKYVRGAEKVGSKIKIGKTISKQNYVRYTLNISKNTRNRNPYVSLKKNDIVKFVEDEPVFCVTVPNHIIFVRRRGKAIWCGNCLAQASRHRIASFSVQSQRYVHDNFGAVVPEAIKENAGCNEIYKQTIESLYNIYDGLTETLQTQYISDGMDAKAAEKKATEDARYILPNAACTKMIVTMNARELMHFFNLRCCFRAQQEIRAVADEMLRQVKEVAPTIFKNAGAPCVSGPCPEGKFSCGHPRGGSNDQ